MSWGTRDRVNVVVAGKQPQADWLSVDAAAVHCARGIGIWDWAGSDNDATATPDVVFGCAGDVPTAETIAASVPGDRGCQICACGWSTSSI